MFRGHHRTIILIHAGCIVLQVFELHAQKHDIFLDESDLDEEIVQEIDINADAKNLFENPVDEGTERRASSKVLGKANDDNNQIEGTEDMATEITEIRGVSLGCFDETNKVRLFAVRLTSRAVFDNCIMLLIFANCCVMTLDDPSIDPDSEFALFLFMADILFTLLFSAEAALKSIAWGFVKEEGSYLQLSGWNKLDFGIIVMAWLDLLLMLMFHDADSLGYLKVVRLLRAFRAVRMVPCPIPLQTFTHHSLSQTIFHASCFHEQRCVYSYELIL